jgi:hypothetical protein
MSLCCQQDDRRDAVRRVKGLNGLDYIEVSNDQLTLTAFFLGKLPPELSEEKPGLEKFLRLEGGQRVTDIQITGVEPVVDPDPEKDDQLVITLDKYGDFSTYTLSLAGVKDIDPRYDHVDFNFKINCPSDLDCAPVCKCEPQTLTEPEINYLAKDYASFRQLILDRLALLVPDWNERHVPDLGIALVELLAYTGDYLSYFQDAVATEAYLDTARQRISVRRHARLVDYRLHEGCNARAWVCVQTDSDFALDPRDVSFITDIDDPRLAGKIILNWDDVSNVPASAYEVFEVMLLESGAQIQFYAVHSEIHFYTWGEKECCLERGSTSATLVDDWVKKEPSPQPSDQAEPKATASQSSRERKLRFLKPGDVLIFEEVLGPITGNPADADQSRRHAVRLTKVTPGEDALYKQPVVEIEWAAEDALPFPFCISAIGEAPECKYLENISVARGNVALVDHGRTVGPEDLGEVPTLSTKAVCECAEHPGDVQIISGRFAPALAQMPLTFSEPLQQDSLADSNWTPAACLLKQQMRQALPQLRLQSTPAVYSSDAERAVPLFDFSQWCDPTELIAELHDPANLRGRALRARLPKATVDAFDQAKDDATAASVLAQALPQLLQGWLPRYDLLASYGDDAHFVAEVDNDGLAHLRFGDGELGQQPDAGSAFFTTYRVSNGSRGNVGAEAISRLVLKNTTLSGVSITVRNPLSAQGGTDAEPLAEAKLFAPRDFRDPKRIQRAIIADDYETIAERNPKVQQASAAVVWTGSWYEADIAIDPFGGEDADDALLEQIGIYLEKYRRIGHDLRVMPARYVPLDLKLEVCALPHYQRAHVKTALLDVFSNRILTGSRRGFFHPDSLTFGEGVFLSKIVATAQAVPGVECVKVTRFQRLFESPNREIENGVLPLRVNEVAQLDNDPSFPEHGKLEIQVGGGR